MTEEKAFVPLEEKTVDFYGDEISAALVLVENEQEVYVPLRPLCEYLGLDWSAQFRRVKRDEVLNDKLSSVAMMATVAGRRYDAVCLPLEFIPGWLFGIDANRVKPELKEKIIRYRRECYRVLWRAFQDEAEPFAEYNPTATQREPNPVLVQIREQALALARLAEQQIEIEAKAIEALDQAYYAHQRLNEFGKFVNRFDSRLGEVERAVSPGTTISTQQAATISQAVKALAEFLTGQLGPTDKAGRVHYQSIFAELYRRFGTSDYKNIRREQYEVVLNFLEDWRQSAGGKPEPRQTSLKFNETEQ